MSFRFRAMVLASSLGVLVLQHSTAQHSTAQTPASEDQSRDILRQSLAASGAANVQTFTATGTMTYFWGGEQVQANTTVRAKGHDQFRLDASVPGGMRSLAMDRHSGARKDADGTLTEIPAHNRLTGSSVATFPYPAIAAALSDAALTIVHLGLVDLDGRQAHQIRVTRTFPKESDPDGLLSKLSAIDYFIDSQTSLVSKTIDLTHPKETLTESYPHELVFTDYATRGGVAVPTVVREKIGGAATWEFRLTDITFNSTLSDSDFTLQ